ncbi:putative GPI-anchored protein pfl2, partial [Penaeus chinensis]|uniref:putative GPI-anchored protein pfl2 n=1 Tax=Penaeus chinensis TaxID=139456 RepID=UPI001FB59F3A
KLFNLHLLFPSSSSSEPTHLRPSKAPLWLNHVTSPTDYSWIQLLHLAQHQKSSNLHQAHQLTPAPLREQTPTTSSTSQVSSYGFNHVHFLPLSSSEPTTSSTFPAPPMDSTTPLLLRYHLCGIQRLHLASSTSGGTSSSSSYSSSSTDSPNVNYHTDTTTLQAFHNPPGFDTSPTEDHHASTYSQLHQLTPAPLESHHFSTVSQALYGFNTTSTSPLIPLWIPTTSPTQHHFSPSSLDSDTSPTENTAPLLTQLFHKKSSTYTSSSLTPAPLRSPPLLSTFPSSSISSSSPHFLDFPNSSMDSTTSKLLPTEDTSSSTNSRLFHRKLFNYTSSSTIHHSSSEPTTYLFRLPSSSMDSTTSTSPLNTLGFTTDNLQPSPSIPATSEGTSTLFKLHQSSTGLSQLTPVTTSEETALLQATPTRSTDSPTDTLTTLQLTYFKGFLPQIPILDSTTFPTADNQLPYLLKHSIKALQLTPALQHTPAPLRSPPLQSNFPKPTNGINHVTSSNRYLCGFNTSPSPQHHFSTSSLGYDHFSPLRTTSSSTYAKALPYKLFNLQTISSTYYHSTLGSPHFFEFPKLLYGFTTFPLLQLIPLWINYLPKLQHHEKTSNVFKHSALSK